MDQYNSVIPTRSLQSLKLLIDGNKRFLNGVKAIDSLASPAKLRELATRTQSPFAIVLTCADSRVPVEAIFDLGLGDLFVLRVAGNVVSPELIASIEYAASQLSTPLCVVMGHTGCGAVDAAVTSSLDPGRTVTENMSQLLGKIMPSVLETRSLLGNTRKEELIKTTTLKNISKSAQAIVDQSVLIRDLIKDSKFAVAEAIFDLKTGCVTFEHDKLTGLPVEIESSLQLRNNK